MLWNGQMEVFVVLAVTLVLAGLMRLEQEPKCARRYARWIQAGLLISLFSKPVVAIILPVLFILPETRRKLLLPLSLYAVVSLLFLLVPRLNPGGYNVFHWLHIPTAAFDTKVLIQLVPPMVVDFAISRTIYSLPAILIAGGAGKPLLLLAKLPLAAVAVMSLVPLILPDRGRRIRAAIVAVSLGLLGTICVISKDSNTVTPRWRHCCPWCSGFGGAKRRLGSAGS